MDVLILVALAVGIVMGGLGTWQMYTSKLKFSEALYDVGLNDRDRLQGQVDDLITQLLSNNSKYTDQMDKLQSMLATAREAGFDPGHSSLFEENTSWSIGDEELEEQRRREMLAGEGEVPARTAEILATMREIPEPDEPEEPSS